MKTILVVEDDKIMRENIAELLDLAGYKVKSARNGKEGVSLAKKLIPDLIICDIKMPELDGYGVLFVLSNDPKTAGIPFIFVTAKTARSDRRKGMEMGADDYLTKPFEDTELLEAVETRLKKSSILNKEFSSNTKGVHEFFSEAGKQVNLKTLTKNLDVEEYKPREIIFRTNDYPHYLYYIDKGQIKTYRLNDDGKELITNIYRSGDFFGYQTILEDKTYDEIAEAIVKSKVQRIPKDDFMALIHQNWSVAFKMIKMISKSLTEKEEELIRMAYDSVRKRVAVKLLEMIPDNGKKAFSLYRTDLAALVGTTSETLIRTLTEFKDLNIIETDGQEIILLDRKKLTEITRNW